MAPLKRLQTAALILRLKKTSLHDNHETSITLHYGGFTKRLSNTPSDDVEDTSKYQRGNLMVKLMSGVALVV